MCPGDNVPQRQCALEDTALVWSLLVGFGTFRHLSYIQNKMDKDISCFILILIGFKYISMSRFKCLLDKLLIQYFRTSSGSIFKMTRAISKEYSVNLVLWSIRIIDTATFWTLSVAADCFILSPLCHAGTASSHPAWCVDQHLKLDSSMCPHTSVWFWTDIMSISFIYCLAQPQLQLQLWPRLALILISPATHPPTEKVFFSKAKQSCELRWT